MQLVRFLVRDQEYEKWEPIITELEKHGYKVETEVHPADITVALSGTYISPMTAHGTKILIAHGQEWGELWGVVYKPIVKEYYDHVLDITQMPINKIVGKLRELIEAD